MKELNRECVARIQEAKLWSETLGLGKAYTSIIDEGGTMMVRVKGQDEADICTISVSVRSLRHLQF